MGWTILRPGGFNSNAYAWAEAVRDRRTVAAPFGDVGLPFIDPADIAAVAARALVTADHEGRSYRLSGPESLLAAERVAVLGRVLDRRLRFEAQSDEEARAEMSAAMTPEYVDGFFSFFVDGTLDESAVLPTVESVLGRPPRSFEEWARANADRFETAAG